MPEKFQTKIWILGIWMVGGLLFTGTLCSQTKQTAPATWTYLGELYLMFPNMKGQTTVRNLPEVTVDANESDILGNLKFGAMFYLEASNGDWSISSDFIYMKLGQGLEGSRLITGGNAEMEELAWELAGLKRVAPWLDLGAGGRLVSLGVGLDMTSALGNDLSGNASKTWVDPIVIARAQGAIQQKWIWQLRGDLGGFGIGSDFTWQLQANAGYRFSKLFQATLGYRYIGIDYDQGSGTDRFLYDVDTFGWVVRLGFHF